MYHDIIRFLQKLEVSKSISVRRRKAMQNLQIPNLISAYLRAITQSLLDIFEIGLNIKTIKKSSAISYSKFSGQHPERCGFASTCEMKRWCQMVIYEENLNPDIGRFLTTRNKNAKKHKFYVFTYIKYVATQHRILFYFIYSMN